MRAACRLAKAGKLDVDIPAYDYPETAKNTVKLGKQARRPRDFDIAAPEGANEVRVRVIGVIENQAPTRALEADLPVEDGLVAMDRPQRRLPDRAGRAPSRHRQRHQRLRLRLRLHAGLRHGLDRGA